MSWEETYRREYPCNCGKSTFTEVGEMDDWNRSREYVIIDCPECAEKAKSAEAERKRQEAENTARLKELILEIKSYFEEHYMQNWLDYFVSARNKKAAWALAKEIGVESQSLSSFYQLAKGSNVEDYVRGLARPNKMLEILAAININDNFLISKVEELVELNKSVNRMGFY